MREAVGGTMLMYIVIFFLVIYIFFMAVVINYGRVFRVKNALITYIEAEEGFKTGTKEKVIQKARGLGYSGDLKVCYTQPSAKATKYFAVQLHITFQLPLVSNSVKIPISGETSAIRNINDNAKDISKCYPNGESNDKFDGVEAWHLQ